MKKLIITLLVLILTGCWNYHELNDYAIVTGMAIDELNNGYEVSILLSNGKKKEDDKTQIKIYSGDGKTINDAIKNISLTMPKKVYLNHLAIIIVSDKIAKKGVTPVLDYLLREPQSYQNFNIVFSKNSKAKDILSIINPLSDYPSQNINEIIKINEKEQGRITNSSFNKLVTTILEKGKNPTVNSIVLQGDKKAGIKKEELENSVTSAYTKLDTIGIFKDDKLIDWATVDESIGINILLNDVKNLYLEIPCQENYITITTDKIKTKKTINKNKISMNITINGNINEIGCNIDLNDNKEITKIENKAKEKLYNYIEKAIIKAKNLETDIFGFGNMIYKKYPNYFNSINNWNLYFKNLDIDVELEFKIKKTNALKQTIGELTK
jgi:spore germination protein KC